MKLAAVNPLIRSSSGSTPEKGDEVHAPLNVNPYAGTPNAPEYENGYEYAQKLGHLRLNQCLLDDIRKWNNEPTAWREGFATAAKHLGVQTVANMLNVKQACWATAYLQAKEAGFYANNAGHLLGSSLSAGPLGMLTAIPTTVMYNRGVNDFAEETAQPSEQVQVVHGGLESGAGRGVITALSALPGAVIGGIGAQALGYNPVAGAAVGALGTAMPTAYMLGRGEALSEIREAQKQAR